MARGPRPPSHLVSSLTSNQNLDGHIYIEMMTVDWSTLIVRHGMNGMITIHMCMYIYYVIKYIIYQVAIVL